MKFKFSHFNITVTNLERSINFYKNALELEECRRVDFGDFIMVYLKNEKDSFELELKWNKKIMQKINLGDNFLHIAFFVNDYNTALRKHNDMQCINFVNENKSIYFIKDPDGYNIEILPENFFETH